MDAPPFSGQSKGPHRRDLCEKGASRVIVVHWDWNLSEPAIMSRFKYSKLIKSTIVGEESRRVIFRLIAMIEAYHDNNRQP